MKKTRRYVLGVGLLAVGLGSILYWSVFAIGSVSASESTVNFLTVRDATYGRLKKNFDSPMKGATPVFPISESALSSFPGDRHIKSVVHRVDWENHKTITHSLQLDDAIVAPEKQGNSSRMAATVLLNYYFGGLEEIGFNTNPTPTGISVGGHVQSASNQWELESPDSKIIVSGTVFVSRESQRATVVCFINEYLASQ